MTKTAPSAKLRKNHSTMPHLVKAKRPPVRRGCMRSAAKTPNWAVKDESTRMIVLISEYVTLSFAVCSSHNPGEVERRVKYTAKRPAKNMTSDPSHTIVPTETVFGRLMTAVLGALTAEVVVTHPLWPISLSANSPVRACRVLFVIDSRQPRVATIVRMPTELAWPAVLTELLAGGDLSISEAEWAMKQVMTGEATDAQLGAFLIALRAKGETVDEIVGFRDAILANARPLEVDPMALDIVG